MSFFYNHLYKRQNSLYKNHNHLKFGKKIYSAWPTHHINVLIHSGLGGKNHLMEKGHINWNRKGRW